MKDLGIIIPKDSTLNSHIIKTISKCRQLTDIYSEPSTQDPQTMITLWKALIIFYIYFCSQLWALHRQSHIVQLEGLQRTFPSSTRKHEDHTGATEKHDYWKRLTEHELHSERRIRRHQVIYKKKVLEGQSTPPKTGPIPPINASNDARTGKKYVQYYLSSKCQALKKEEPGRLFNHLPK